MACEFAEAETNDIEVLDSLEALESRCATRRVQAVKIDGIESIVYIRMVAAGEMDKMMLWHEQNRKAGDKVTSYREKIVTMVLSDSDGNRIVGDNDIDRIKKLDTDVVQAIFDAGIEFNTPTTETIEEIEKN